MPSADIQARQRDGVLRTAISDGMVALLKEFYGVGPKQAKTYYYDDLVVCLLRGGFTRVEQTLLEEGRTAAVIQQRVPGGDAGALRQGHPGCHRPPCGRVHERQPAGPRHDLRGVRARPH